MIKLPKDFIEADYKFDSVIPITKLETVKTSEGFDFRIMYETNEVQEFVQHAAHEMNEKIEAAIMDELLRLNGYVPERTCQMMPTFTIPTTLYNIQEYTCNKCDKQTLIEVLGDDEDVPKYCSYCGAKVVE